MIGQKLFTVHGGIDPRTQAQKEFAQITDWQKKLFIGDFEFTPEQQEEIEKLFDAADWEELRRIYKPAWFAVVRRVLHFRDRTLRQQLGLPESEAETMPKRNTKPEPEEAGIDQS